MAAVPSAGYVLRAKYAGAEHCKAARRGDADGPCDLVRHLLTVRVLELRVQCGIPLSFSF